MPTMPNTLRDYGREMAKALAGWQNDLPTQRNAAEGSRMMRLLYGVWDVALVGGFCTAVFWIWRIVMVW